jgi:hypothetical protein
MTFGTERRNRFSGSDQRPLPPNALPQRVLGGVALAFVVTLCAWTVSGFADTGADQTDLAAIRGNKVDNAVTFVDRFARANRPGDVYASPFDGRFPDQTDVDTTRAVRVGAAVTFADRFARADRLADVYVSPFDARFSFAGDAPQRSGDDLTADIPLPRVRDRGTKSAVSTALRLSPAHSTALRDSGQSNQAASDTPANKPTIFQRILEKLFGKPAPVKLAYAATDDAGLSAGGSIAAGRYDRWTAVYDISAHTVYMPDGTRLEAHSGFADRLDDPSHPDEKMRGVTPPNIYDLALRESPFHGVRALRLIPEDEDKVFGRRGLLAHRYMLGPNGDSNGCVSIKNYDAFLQAYLNHDIKRLAVVTRLE